MCIRDRVSTQSTWGDKTEQDFNQIVEQKKGSEDQTKQYEEEKRMTQANLESTKKQLDDTKKKKDELEKQYAEQNEILQKIQYQIKTIDNDIASKHKEIQLQEMHNKKQLARNTEMDTECIDISQRIEEIYKSLEELKVEMAGLEQQQELLDNNIKINEKDCEDLVNIREKCDEVKEITIQGINLLENQVNFQKKDENEDKITLEELRRNRDILQKDIDRCDNNNKKQLEERIQKEKVLKEKDNELYGLNKEMDQLNQSVKSLEKEKEKYGIQAAQANAKYFHSLEEIKLKDNLISEFQKKNIETEAKLKQQQNLYEAVRSDRNLYSKNLTESQEELQEIKRRYKIVNHSISQLKEEIEQKELALAKEHFEHKKKDKHIEEQANILKRYRKDIKDKEEKIKQHTIQISKLHFMIKESEQQCQELKKEYELVVAERDILGTQLIRRNSEAGLLYEKIKINQSTLKKGEVQYKERLGDIMILKSQIADLINEIKDFKSQSGQIPDMGNEVHNLQKELIEEKLKVKSLSEEQENPMNVHRWRKLEATDSETYELMIKIQSLQKRLISKTEEVLEKEKVVEQKEKQLKELREIMNRQPGIEEGKQIPVLVQNLQQKSIQMNAMQGEIALYSSHIQEYQLEKDRLSKDLQDIKKKFFEQKKREQRRAELKYESQNATTIPITQPEKRFTGGGFNLCVTQQETNN
eukprot:TRINITY_DN1287_c0_g1_i7.p1 TRINITY_DN1287_c0_g1~~TRINITY_DN1287_c0_g1_i7.p1  ORF type:complete len:699 (-),score=223.57 TRINITY_DN1287_c0_g1_i7:296-2392(-)